MIKFFDILSNSELRRRALFTLTMLLVYRLGAQISIPGVNVEVLIDLINGQSGTNNVFNLFNMMSAGALERFSIFALGIAPYITASIVFQLLGVVIPTIENLQKKEGEAGRIRVDQWTRYLTVGIALLQSFMILSYIQSIAKDVVVINDRFIFQLICIVTLVTGSMFVMWIGEQITDRGIGNGISLLIFSGIVVRLPSNLVNIIYVVRHSLNRYNAGYLGIVVFFLLVMIFVFVLVVLIESSCRHIPILYTRRANSCSVVSQHSSYLPIKINIAGVMPVIFASSALAFPAIIAKIVNVRWLDFLSAYADPYLHLYSYTLLNVILTVLFAFFYVSIIFNPDETADNIKKSGGYIPGIRPGKDTSTYINNILSKLTLIGALYLAVIVVLPLFIGRVVPDFKFQYGGTSLLIVVSVALDVMVQLESYQVMHYYDEGFFDRRRMQRRRYIKNKGGLI